MNNYYLIPIPIFEGYIKSNGQRLNEIIDLKYPILRDRENERIRILYSVSPLKEFPTEVRQKYYNYNNETVKILDSLNIPYYIIAYGNDNVAKEILTGIKIESEFPAALGIRKTTKEKAEQYFNSTNYSDKIKTFSDVVEIVNAEPFVEYYDLNGYIEGTIDGKPLSGNFKGRIRTKQTF